MGSVIVGVVLEQEQDELLLFLAGCLMNGDLVDWCLVSRVSTLLYLMCFSTCSDTQAWLGLVTKLCLLCCCLHSSSMSCVVTLVELESLCVSRFGLLHFILVLSRFWACTSVIDTWFHPWLVTDLIFNPHV
jgi:hypothetical protein